MNTDDNSPLTKKDLAELRAEFKSDLSALEGRLDIHLSDRMAEQMDRMTELMRDIETSMLTAFHSYESRSAH